MWFLSRCSLAGAVLISEMRGIMFGQRTEKFRRGNREDLSDHSFSITYVDQEKPGGTDTLDLVGVDEVLSSPFFGSV